VEPYLPISYLNDFIFCPNSIYCHQLFGKLSTSLYHSPYQTEGLAAHSSIEEKRYSSKKAILQGIDIYCDAFNLCGKIDLFDVDKKTLIERKKMIKTIYDGYIFQLYAQYYSLVEMGYEVEKLQLYSLDTNKAHPVKLPDQYPEMKEKFIQLISDIQNFNPDNFIQTNKQKCEKCIYVSLCTISLA
jgi:CRISPR-associated protein Cas4